MTAPDFRDPALIADPYPALAALRDAEPVHWNPGLNAWVLTRHADIDRAFKDPRFSSDRIRPFVAGQRQADPADARLLGDCLSLWMVFNDPPLHTRLRALVNQAFSRRAVEALRPRIAALVADLLAPLPARGEVEVIEAIAWPLPALVIAELLGVPRDDLEDLKRWSDDLAAFVLAARLDPGRHARAAAALARMNAYFADLIAARRRAPGERILDALIAAHDGEDRLSLDELLASCVLLLFAGHETTAHFFGNGLRALALHPDAAARLRGAPPEALRTALNELLRWDGPSTSQVRVLAADVALHGVTMPAGARVYLMLLAANRDPAVFADPDRLDLARPEAARHLTFGAGIHVCLGAHLARLEGEVALPLLLDRLGRLAPTGAPEDWSDSLVIRGLTRLPLRYGGR